MKDQTNLSLESRSFAPTPEQLALADVKMTYEKINSVNSIEHQNQINESYQIGSSAVDQTVSMASSQNNRVDTEPLDSTMEIVRTFQILGNNIDAMRRHQTGDNTDDKSNYGLAS